MVKVQQEEHDRLQKKFNDYKNQNHSLQADLDRERLVRKILKFSKYSAAFCDADLSSWRASQLYFYAFAEEE